MNIFIEINNNVGRFLNTYVLENNLEKTIGFLADFPIFFLPIFLLGTWIFWTYKIKDNNKKTNLLNIVYGVILAIIINLIIQNIITIERPESLVEPILKHIPDASFPSDHAAVSFAFLTGLIISGYKKIGYIFSIFAVLMIFSRVAGGIHWFFDIIVGAIVGIISSIIIFRNSKIFKKINDLIIRIMNYIKL